MVKGLNPRSPQKLQFSSTTTLPNLNSQNLKSQANSLADLHGFRSVGSSLLWTKFFQCDNETGWERYSYGFHSLLDVLKVSPVRNIVFLREKQKSP